MAEPGGADETGDAAGVDGTDDGTVVTVVMPVRDEAAHLPASLGSVLAQDWPPDRLQVLVVDGGSVDGTAEVARRVAEAADRHVEIVDNPAGIVPVAMNLGLARARGQVVVRVDGHCTIAPHHVRRCVELLDATGADCAGGVLTTVGETPGARAVAAAQSHPLGVGPVSFRTGTDTAGPVDTLAFGAYRREVFERIGGFDEELVRNQDDELNLRLREAGGTIWLDPTLHATYSSRTDLAGLWRQYEGYGSWKVRVMQKHRGVASWRHLVPATLVAALASTGLLAAGGRRGPLAALLGTYGAAIGLASARAPVAPDVRLRMPAAFATLHLAYGVGTWRGLWRWRAGWLAPPLPVGPPPPWAEAGERGTTDEDATGGTDGGASPRRPTPRPGAADAERARVRAAYRSYEDDDRTQARWDPDNAGNRAMLAERDAVLDEVLDQHPAGRHGVRVLDLGCGSGEVLAGLVDAGVPAEHVLGLDVRPEAVEALRARRPDLPVRATEPDVIDLPSGSIDVVVAFTVFSSIHDEQVARALGAEVERVLAPGGALVWYDLRVPNPRNREVRACPRPRVRALFPALRGSLEPVTLLPAVARRLGPLTGLLYRRLARGPLRTHLLGVLRRSDRPLATPAGEVGAADPPAGEVAPPADEA